MHAHGRFHIWLDNRVILARVTGQCNKEMALKYSTQFKDIANPLVGQPWAHIVYLDDWDLATPEVEGIITDLVTWLVANGLMRTAQVYSPNMLKKFQIDRMVKSKIDHFTRQVFDNGEDAFEWLSQEGFPVTRAVLHPVET